MLARPGLFKRVTAGLEQSSVTLILEGEAPYDIFVRWAQGDAKRSLRQPWYVTRMTRVAAVEEVSDPAGRVGQAEEGPMNTGLATTFLHFGRRCSIFHPHGSTH